MKGHIRPRGRGTWAIVIEQERGLDGKRCQKWHTVKGTKRDAERELARLVHAVNSGSYVAPQRVTVGEHLERWLTEEARHRLSVRSFDRYAHAVRAHLVPALGSVALQRLTPAQIQHYYTTALESGRLNGRGGLSDTSVHLHHRVLRAALDQAVRWQLIHRNPAAATKPPQPGGLDAASLTEDQIAILLTGSVATRYYMPVLLAVTTGMRRNEILGLRWSDIDLDRGVLSVRQALEDSKSGIAFKEPKTAKGRRPIELPSLTTEALRRHKGQQATERLQFGPAYQRLDLVVARPDGSPWTPVVLSRGFGQLARRLGLPKMRFHDLRHTHATWMLSQGENPKVVAERLGHSTVSITLDRYSHVLPDLQKDAARRLDERLRRLPFANGLQSAE